MSQVRECGGRKEYARCVVSAAEAAGDVEFLRSARVMITGATGMIGGALARTLAYLSRERGLGVSLILPVRNLERAKELSDDLAGSDVSVFEADIARPFGLAHRVDYIVHAAAVTGSKELAERPASTLEALVRGQLNLLDLAREQRVKRFVGLSSMEVYGIKDGEVAEADLGYVALDSPRSCYPEAKRLGELACLCCAREYGLNACSLRLAQTFGAGVRPDDGRAFMQFALSALRGEDIVLKTEGKSIGNYLHIADAVSAILTLMRSGEAGVSYNAAGDGCHASIKELALLISELLSDGKSRVVCQGIAPERLPYAPDTGFIMRTDRLKALNWIPRYSLEDMIRSLGRDILERKLLPS